MPLSFFCNVEPCPGSLAAFDAEWQCGPWDGGHVLSRDMLAAIRIQGCNRVRFESRVYNPVLLHVFDLTTGALIGAGREDDVYQSLGDYPCLDAAYVAGEWKGACDEVTTEVCVKPIPR